MNGCAAFAQVVEASRVEAELLPQLWEQVYNISPIYEIIIFCISNIK